MTWEPIEALPNEPRAGHEAGPFRAVSEPVQATRTAPSWLERARLSFGGTPDLPAARAGHQVLVTAGYVYVRRADGTRQRVPREALTGRRVEPGRVVYGVRADEDLMLLARPNCPVQAVLDAQLGSDELPIHVATSHQAMLQLFFALAAFGLFGRSLAFLRSGPHGVTQLIAIGALPVLLHALAATSMDQVRQAAGVSNGSLYHHFPTKAQLADALYAHTLRGFHAALLVPITRRATAQSGVKGLIRAYIRWVEANPERARLLDELGQSGGTERDAANAEGLGTLGTWIAGRVAAGDMRDMPFPVWMALVFSPVRALTRHWVAQPQPEVPAKVRAALEHAAWMSVAS